ncbi:MAG: hypothetical protein JO065_14510 [Acidobacteria bacterium]|nr:hypothetical protein [Acidobacteriota bacterium]
MILACSVDVSEALKELELKNSELKELQLALAPRQDSQNESPCFLREVEQLVDRTLALRHVVVST